MFINSFISWIGGKKALRNVIYRIFPKNYGRYIEVFGGGGWVLFGKKPDQNVMEVYNDFNSNLANLFYCVKPAHGNSFVTLAFFPSIQGMSFMLSANLLKKMNLQRSISQKNWNWRGTICPLRIFRI